MGVLRHLRAVSAALLMASSAFTATALADASMSGSRHGAESTIAARADTVGIRIVNQTAHQVRLYVGEARTTHTVGPNGRSDSQITVPWVGDQGEMGKSIVIYWDDNVPRHFVFQDYWNPQNMIKYNRFNDYRSASPVPGDNISTKYMERAKTLFVQSNGSLRIQNQIR